MQVLEAFYCPLGDRAKFAVGILASGDDPPAAGIAMTDQKSLGIFDRIADGAGFEQRQVNYLGLGGLDRRF